MSVRRMTARFGAPSGPAWKYAPSMRVPSGSPGMTNPCVHCSQLIVYRCWRVPQLCSLDICGRFDEIKRAMILLIRWVNIALQAAAREPSVSDIPTRVGELLALKEETEGERV